MRLPDFRIASRWIDKRGEMAYSPARVRVRRRRIARRNFRGLDAFTVSVKPHPGGEEAAAAMNHMVFSTGGDWDSTTLQNNNQEVLAAELYVDLKAGRNDFGEAERGGVANGGEMQAFVRPQEDPQQQIAIFPGRLDMTFPGHTLVIENTHPTFAFEFTRVWYNGNDVTHNVMDVFVDINALDNDVKAYVTIYKPHWIASDEIATYNIL